MPVLTIGRSADADRRDGEGQVISPRGVPECYRATGKVL